MEYLIANLAGRTRREKLHGREHIVAPMTLIVSGVLNGTKGPLYYPPEEVELNPSVWNDIPLLVHHPTPASARGGDPEVLNAQGIGRIFNAKAQGGRLTAEGWFDVERLKRIDNRILKALVNNKPLELSTGLFTDDEEVAEGTKHNGVLYKAIARNYRPDHLAILPDTTGACSIKDGCGVLVNAELKSAMDAYLTANNLPLTEESDMAKMTDKQRKTAVDFIVANCEQCSEEDREGIAELTDNVLTAWQDEIKAIATTKKDTEAAYNVVTKEHTDEAGNKSTWNAKENKWETEIKAPPKKEDKTVDNKDKKDKPQTDEEWYAAAPAGVQNTFAHARELEHEAKQTCVEKLTANVKDEQEQAKQATRLMNRPLSELKADAALVPDKPERVFPGASYAGQAPGRPTENVTKDFPDFDPHGHYLPEDPKEK